MLGGKEILRIRGGRGGPPWGIEDMLFVKEEGNETRIIGRGKSPEHCKIKYALRLKIRSKRYSENGENIC